MASSLALLLLCALLSPHPSRADATPTTSEPLVATHVFVRIPVAEHPKRPRRVLVPSPAIQLAPPPSAAPSPEERDFEAEPILPDRRRTPPHPGPRHRLVAEGVAPRIAGGGRLGTSGGSASRSTLGERLLAFAQAAVIGTAVAVAFVGGAYLLLVATIAALAWRERRHAPPPPSIVVEFDLDEDPDPCPSPRARRKR